MTDPRADLGADEKVDEKIDLGTDRLAGRGDEVYTALIAAHEGLTEAESAALNARLILILINLVGDAEAIEAAIDRARRAG